MVQHAVDLFRELLEDAIDLATIPKFAYYKDLTTAYAERIIISLMEEGRLYKYNDRLLVRKFGRLCCVYINKARIIDVDADDTIIRENSVRIDLPFSPKWICDAQYKSKHLRRITDYFLFNQVMSSIAYLF
ncbi:MAG: hypothetical protein [Bacteriophage sp.]|nr:MAG: hypothetical protein [Bacteriophage sp.]